MPTRQNSFEAFDINSLLREIGAYAQYEDGAERYILSAAWIDNIGLLEQIRTELNETALFLKEYGYPSDGSSLPLRKILADIRVKDVPFPEEYLLQLKLHLETVKKIASYGREEIREKFPSLSSYHTALIPLPALHNELKKMVGNNGEILDGASPELKEIRRSLEKAVRELQSRAERIKKKYEKYLQESQTSIRNGRIVLSVIDSHFRKVRGIVHGRSATGITVFVEPEELVEANNSIEELKSAEKVEIYRLMVRFANICRDEESSLLQNWETLCYLDSLQARAKWMNEHGGNAANYNSKDVLALKNARHPLLVKRLGINGVVPLNLELNRERRFVLVTGPNAGGKTVMLKTVAVNVILAQLGMPVLADSDSSFPVFSKILFDIGDRQSLEDDLSTFSAHLQNLKWIAEEADEKSLVLIDELGTGTDPVEGAALSRALLENLLESRALGVVNSHHGSLKIFAHEANGISNASMEFDTTELRPTYRLLMDVPGSSYALEIAERMKFPREILQKAEELLGDERKRTENLILNLQEKLAETEKLKKELDLAKNKFEALEKLYKNSISRLEKNKKELEKKAVEEAQEIVKKANALIEKTVKQIREKQADKEVLKKARKNINELKREIDEQKKKFQKEKKLTEKHEFSPGDKVEWIKMNQKGEVLEVLGENSLLLAVGNLKLRAPAGECRYIGKGKNNKKTNAGKGVSLPEVGMEIDLRGKYTDEAEYLLEKYLSDAAAADWREVRIIHGHGTGALKNMVTKFLKRCSCVKRFRSGLPGEGGLGVTIAELK